MHKINKLQGYSIQSQGIWSIIYITKLFLTGKILLYYSFKKRKHQEGYGIHYTITMLSYLFRKLQPITIYTIFSFTLANEKHWQTDSSFYALVLICKWGTGLHFLASMKLWKIQQAATNSHLYLNRDPNRINPDRWELFWTGPTKRKEGMMLHSTFP